MNKLSFFDSRLSLGAGKAGIALYHSITAKLNNMKKFGFALHLFGWLAIFPLYGFFEINHLAEKSITTQVSAGFQQKNEEATRAASAKKDDACMTIVLFKKF